MANKRVNKKQNERVRAAKATNNAAKVTEEQQVAPVVEETSSEEEKKVDLKKVENEGNTIAVVVEESSSSLDKDGGVVYSTDWEYKNDSLTAALREGGIDLTSHFQTVEVDPVKVNLNVSPEEEKAAFASEPSTSETEDVEAVEAISDYIDQIIADEAKTVEEEPYVESFEEKVTNKVLSALSRKDRKRIDKIVSVLSDNKELSGKAEEVLLLVKDGMTEEDLRVLFAELNKFCDSLEEAMKASPELNNPKFFVSVNKVLNHIPRVIGELTGIESNARVVIKKMATTSPSEEKVVSTPEVEATTPEKETVDLKKVENEGNTIGVVEESTEKKDAEASAVKEEAKTSETKEATASESSASASQADQAEEADADETLEIIFIDDLDEEKFKSWSKPLFVKSVQEYWRTNRGSKEWCKDVQRCHQFNLEHGFKVQLI